MVARTRASQTQSWLCERAALSQHGPAAMGHASKLGALCTRSSRIGGPPTPPVSSGLSRKDKHPPNLTGAGQWMSSLTASLSGGTRWGTQSSHGPSQGTVRKPSDLLF